MSIDSAPSLKVELQLQMAEALKTNNEDLFVLLKGQWAHRFGVDTLPDSETLKALDLGEKIEEVDIGLETEGIPSSINDLDLEEKTEEVDIGLETEGIPSSINDLLPEEKIEDISNDGKNEIENLIANEKNTSVPSHSLDSDSEEQGTKSRVEISPTLNSLGDHAQGKELSGLSESRNKSLANIQALIPTPPLPKLDSLRRWLYN